MQSKAVEYAHLEALRRHRAAPTLAASRNDFLNQSQRAACFLMGMSVTALAMYNLALWLLR
jgi:hypothetical protein